MRWTATGAAVASAGGLKFASGSPSANSACKPRYVELSGHEIALIMLPLDVIHGLIELDQGLGGLDHLPVADMNGAHDAGLEGLDDLGASARDDLAFRRANNVDPTDKGPCERDAKRPMME